jgi:uncharacterized repeat protein (TIGR03803 family)
MKSAKLTCTNAVVVPLALACMVVIIFATTVIPSAAQATLKTLLSFDKTNGESPASSLVQATDGNFYGTTSLGGASDGTIFKITPTGTLTTLHSFDGTDGFSTQSGLIQAPNGDLYGTTVYGGAAVNGTIFKITLDGTFTTLHSFDGTDGSLPYAGLIRANDGNFYGTTQAGGASQSCGSEGCGTVFEITPGGTLTTLHRFDLTDGSFPYAGLIQAADGSFYGTTVGGGNLACNSPYGCGTVFKITRGGTLTTLHSFDLADGSSPYTGLTQATDGNFYGTARAGGASQSCGSLGCGTVFEITPGGTLTTLHSFDDTDGSSPLGVLVQANGNFYGLTEFGGGYGRGTAFRIDREGTLTLLRSFNGTDGEAPLSGLIQSTDGSFYGTTSLGGGSHFCNAGCGTVFSLSVGLGPFVEIQPSSGQVGEDVIIFGTNLKGATAVGFNDTVAAFKVVSGREIVATVPAGATTGKIEVTIPNGTLSSNVVFRVR